MEIQELYSNSARLVKSVNTRFVRYTFDMIDWNMRMLCLRGARGIGKTTLMLQYLKIKQFSPTKALYVSLDDLWFNDHRLIDLADYHYAHGGSHLFLDEVHRYAFQSWSQELKNIYDRYPEMHIVFSGSSMLQLDKASVDLSRRCIFYDMQGLSFREYLMLEHNLSLPLLTIDNLLSSHIEIATEVCNDSKIIPLFDEYLHHGYYPFYREVRNNYSKILQQIASNIIDIDLPAMERIEYLTANKLKRLFVVISQQVPFTLNISSLGQQIEAPRQSVLRMCKLLQQSDLLLLLYNKKNDVNKPEKVYLENPNLLYAMSANAEIGNVRETFFINQLKQSHTITYSHTGDFKVDYLYTIEVGGKNKKFNQIKDLANSYLAVDDIEIGYGNRIPLWMFGLLY